MSEGLPKDSGRFKVDWVDKNTIKVTADTWEDPAAEILACFERMFWVEDWAIEARKALEAGEWRSWVQRERLGQIVFKPMGCAVCLNTRSEGHTPDCILSKAIAKAKGDPP